MSDQAYYITTPIYYVNDRPHIGHAYTTVATDVLARFARLRGRPARMLTGLDEHGLKVERAAQKKGLEPQAFVDSMAAPFQDAWTHLRCAPDDFIRTTEARHREKAQALWRRLEEAGDVYLGEYEGWYSVSSEQFFTEKELLPGNLDPISKKPVEKVREQSYFFRLSQYTDRLLAWYDAHPGFVQPQGRFNEVKSFVAGGLRDLSISRTSFRWGIPVPSANDHVMYVWLDALTNYMSALGGPTEPGSAPLFDQFWGENAEITHIVGKDILRFHAVYWPAFLMSAGLPLPTRIWAHGWLTVDGEKMSKSLGNFIPPEPLVDAFGADVLRYYLMRELAFGQDGDFSHDNLFARYQGELANGLGNLLRRMVASIVANNLGGTVPDVTSLPNTEEENVVIEAAQAAAKKTAERLTAVAPQKALDAIWEFVAVANRYVDRTAPWALAKEGNTERLAQVAYTVLESLRWLSIMVWPFMPDKSDMMRAQLGLPALSPAAGADLWPAEWGQLPAGTQTAPGDALFPRFDKKQQRDIRVKLGIDGDKRKDDRARENASADKSAATPSKSTAKKADGNAIESGAIEFEDFLKVDLRVGTIQSAEPVKKSNKLLRLLIDIGEPEPRQVLAGISKHYAPEQLAGTQVVVVANLKPRTMMGLTSHGMVLAGSDEQAFSVLRVEKPIKPGTRVS